MVDGMRWEPQRLGPEDVAALASYGATARWPAGFTIYESDGAADGVFVVLRGQVVLRSRVKAGRGFVPALVTPGGTFGLEGLAEDARYRTDARAESEVETLHLSSPRFRALVRERPQHAFALLGQVFDQRSMLLERLGELSALSVEQRLVNALLRMAAARAAESEVIELPPANGRVTRGLAPLADRPAGGNGSAYAMAARADDRHGGDGSDGNGSDGNGNGTGATGSPLLLDPAGYRLLCEMVGATRESVSLVMARLVADGTAERRGSDIVIPVPGALLRRNRRGSRADRTADRGRRIPVQREPELAH